MPGAPPTHPCVEPGCGMATQSRYCDRHAAAAVRSSHRVYDRAWRRLSAAHLRGEPLCRECATRGHNVLAIQVDHILPVSAAAQLRLVDANLQSLCLACHAAKTRAGE